MNSDTPRTEQLRIQNRLGQLTRLELIDAHCTLERENQQLQIKLVIAETTNDELLPLIDKNQQLRDAAGFCDKHKPDGGHRNCLVCGCEKLSFALDKISYTCGEPNEMGVSNYSVNYDEYEVVKQVEQLRDDLKQCTEALILAKQVTSNGFLPNSNSGRFDKTHFDIHSLIDKALSLPSVQAALKEPKQ